MKSKKHLRLVVIVCGIGGAIALTGWGYDRFFSRRADSQDTAASEVTPLTSMPVYLVAANAKVQFDLFLGSGFLIKDCGDNGVDIGGGINRGDIIVRRKDVDLYVSRTSGSEQVICTHFFSESDNANKAIRFADGSKVDYYDIAGN